MIEKMEKGQVDPRLSQLQALARGLEISMTHLLGEYTPAEPAAAPDDLSHREREVDRLIASGFTNPQIADELSVALRTVKTYRARAITKLGVSTRAEIVAYARRAGLL